MFILTTKLLNKFTVKRLAFFNKCLNDNSFCTGFQTRYEILLSNCNAYNKTIKDIKE